jgi:hypothetical protein
MSMSKMRALRSSLGMVERRILRSDLPVAFLGRSDARLGIRFITSVECTSRMKEGTKEHRS